MQQPPVLANEVQRLDRLARLQVLDTAAEAVLDRLTALAASITGEPIALISLVDHYRQWWKSAVGILPQGGQTAKDVSFCAHAIAQPYLFEVEDARVDPRFADSPLVTQAPHIVHYAGMPLTMPTGERIGTICVLDHQPGRLDAAVTEVMRQLAGLVVDVLVLRERDREAAAAIQADAQRRASDQRIREMADVMPQMLWSALPDGRADHYNARWYQFTGATPEMALGDGWDTLVHPDDRRALQERWQHCVETGESFEFECRLRHASGQYRWVLARAEPLRGREGHIERWIGSNTDVHAQHLARERLQVSDRQKDDFLAMLAHELRNPLAPIASGAELLTKLPEPRSQRVGTMIRRQADHLRALVDDLLDVSRVTRGLVELHLEEVDLREVVDAALEQAAPLMACKAQQVVVHPMPHTLPVHGDRVRLTQVLVNLLNNAIKYTPEHGQVEVNATSEAGTMRLSVRDNGQGIDASLLPHVFDLFTQERRSGDRHTGGLGLGLALVRSLAQLHGGSVLAESPGKGRGSTFTLSLPGVDSDPTPLTEPTQEGEVLRQAGQDGVAVASADIPSADTQPRPPTPLGNRAPR